MHDAPILRVVRLKGANMITHNTLSFVILRGSCVKRLISSGEG